MTTEAVDYLASGSRCQCSGRDCAHAERCTRQHDVGPDILTRDNRNRLLCGGCRRILQPDQAEAITADIAEARRRLQISKGQLSLF